MKKILAACCCLFLFAVPACFADLGSNPPKVSPEQVSPEFLTKRAESKFLEYLASRGGDRKAATEETAAHLRTLSGVKKVTVRGSDSLFVIMQDGNELFLMLGKDRL